MTKAAILSFTVSLAEELGPRGITVNAIAPGATEIDLISAVTAQPALAKFYTEPAALKRLCQPDDIAMVAGFLASLTSGWITGQVTQASGGVHL